MIFKLHYFCLAAGANALGILLGVYIDAYTDATPFEIGLLYMLMPFVGMASRPIICSYTDRRRAHRKYIMICLFLTAFSYFPFVLIPFLGPEVHKTHRRFCWYLLLLFKVIGDITFGGVVSIGDSLAINYAKRIGTDFSVYRVWGTISWMFFGLVVGQLNEIWFLPKYVAGFMILVVASLINMFVVYLWPKEYFVMVTPSMMKKENEQYQLQQTNDNKKKSSSITRSLMPKEVVLAHAKKQLWSLITCSCFSASQDDEPPHGSQSKRMDQSTVAEQQVNHGADHAGLGSGDCDCGQNDAVIDKKTQIRTLMLLLRREPRIVGYLLTFIASGAAVMPVSFFFMSLTEICNKENRCNFSQLGGFLQVSMALAETFLLVYVKQIIAVIGRLNTLSIAFGLTALKYIFYGTIWSTVNPHYALLIELAHGVIWGIFLTLSVEMAHLFATEVEYIIPELMALGVLKKDDETSRERLKLSLSATMQALIASASDGLGRGIGALIYGRIIDAYNEFETLWLIIGIGATVVFVVLQMTNLLIHCLSLEVGLDEAAKKEALEDISMKDLGSKVNVVMIENGTIVRRGSKLDKAQQQQQGGQAAA